MIFVSIQERIREHLAAAGRGDLIVKASMGIGNWAKVPWLAVMDPRVTKSTQNGVYCVYLFREDMSGVYLTLNQGVTEPKKMHGVREGRRVVQERASHLRTFSNSLTEFGFIGDDQIDLRASSGLGRDYEHSTIAYRLYERGQVPADEILLDDLDALVSTYHKIVTQSRSLPPINEIEQLEESTLPTRTDFTLRDGVKRLIRRIGSQGYIFEPWQIAHFVTAVRTKPFVILAGISGTGKSKLPLLVAKATGSSAELIPVRPDWTDSSDVLGYIDLKGEFKPGGALRIARDAMDFDDRFWFCVLDEMNLARVELYFAEVLSKIEDRTPASSGGFVSSPLVSQPLAATDREWGEVFLGANLAIIGTVNMDESTQGFSRKVLDRAFVIELSDVNLEQWGAIPGEVEDTLPSETWPVHAWQSRATSLAQAPQLTREEVEEVRRCIEALLEVNRYLTPAQLQVGYRSRDEIALFLINAKEIADSFVTRDERVIDPLDLAVLSKVLPRIVGGHGAIRRAVANLLQWASSGGPESDEIAASVVDRWVSEGRPSWFAGCRYPLSAARLCLMHERLDDEGYTSFWL
jgi:hypothetical protein